MTTPRLTIAIPSYNRASRLDRQLAWAVNAIDGRWNECELIVSDNASPDNTPQVCEAWRAASQGKLRVIRQPKNIGLVRNVLACINAAHGDFVWVVGDDDTILPETFPWVLDCVRRESPTRLGYVLLNFRTTNNYGGDVIQDRVYPFQDDIFALPGMDLFQKCVALDEFHILLISANVYSTQLAKQAVERWPAMVANLAFPLFLSGYASAHAGMLIHAEPSLVYPHHTASHLKTWLNTVFLDLPAAYLALLEEGYSESFIRPRILSRLSLIVYGLYFPLQFLKSLRVYFRALRLRKR